MKLLNILAKNKNTIVYYTWRMLLPAIAISGAFYGMVSPTGNPLNILTYAIPPESIKGPFFMAMLDAFFFIVLVLLYLSIDKKFAGTLHKGASNKPSIDERFEPFGTVLIIAVSPGRTTFETEDHIVTVKGEVAIIKKGEKIELCKNTKRVKLGEQTYSLVG